MSSRLVNGSWVVPLLTSQYLCALTKVVYQPSLVMPSADHTVRARFPYSCEG